MNHGTTLVAYRLDVGNYNYSIRKTVYCTATNLVECIDGLESEMQENDLLIVSKVEVRL